MTRDELLHSMIEEHAKTMAFDPDYDNRKMISGWFKCALSAIEAAGYAIVPVDMMTKLNVAAECVIGHWNEFGPEHDFAETIHLLECVLHQNEEAARAADGEKK